MELPSVLTLHVYVRHVCALNRGFFMPDNDIPLAINLISDGSAPGCNSGISTAPPLDSQQDTNTNSATEWIRCAMQISKEMHRNEDVRREVAKRLF